MNEQIKAALLRKVRQHKAKILIGLSILFLGAVIVALRTAPWMRGAQIQAGGGRTSTVTVTWEGRVAMRDLTLPTEADQWELVIHYELRPGGGGDVIAFQSVTSDCRPTFDQAGSGECGLAATVTWQTADLLDGWYEIFVKGVWTDGEEVVFCDVSGSLGHDGEWWYLIDKFEVTPPPVIVYQIYLPVVLKVSPTIQWTDAEGQPREQQFWLEQIGKEKD